MACVRPLFALLFLAVAVDLATGRFAANELSSSHGHLRAATGETSESQGKVFQMKWLRPKRDSVIGGVIFGIILWWLVPVCLWNNERIAIKQYKMQLKAERWCVHIEDEKRAPIKELDGRIVYLTGKSEVKESLTDDKFADVKSEGKIKLRRVVEMFQWIEHEEKGDDDRPPTYTYTRDWRDSHEACPHAADKQNPEFPMASSRRSEGYRLSKMIGSGNGEKCAEAKHENVKLGEYYLGEYVIRELENWQPKTDITAEMLKNRKMPAPNGLMKGDAEERDGYWYFGGHTNEIGACRVRFEELCPGPTTIVGVLAQTEKGWTFVPIMRADAAGTGDSFCAELGGSCCVTVKELHYTGEAADDDELKQDLEDRPKELTDKEVKGFHRAATSTAVEEYNPEEGMEDLCCVGPFGGFVIKAMHAMGLEEEFLGVAEKDEDLHKIMAREGQDAANRHHLARVAGLILLILGANAIISPITKLLTMNWLATALGGGLIAAFLWCMACLCSCSAWLTIISVSWMAHRPFLASAGIATAVLIGVGLYVWLSEEEKKHSRPGHSSFLGVHHTAAYSATMFQAVTQALGTATLH